MSKRPVPGGTSLTSLDLTSFDTNNVTTMYRMFYRDSNLKTIKVDKNKWIINQETNTTDMFNNCGTTTVTFL